MLFLSTMFGDKIPQRREAERSPGSSQVHWGSPGALEDSTDMVDLCWF